MWQIHDGTTQPAVLALLGQPDVIRDGDPEVGTYCVWEYHERLPDHADLVVGFACGVVCYSSLRQIPDSQFRAQFRGAGHSCPV